MTKPARMPKGSSAPQPQLTSRTTTLDDPLTTSLLAEVTRRTPTVDVSADQIEAIEAASPAADAASSERESDESI
jgi:hypothetical protein